MSESIKIKLFNVQLLNMIQFDEEKRDKKLDDLKKLEEEEAVQILATAKYKLPYINLLTTAVENSALRLVSEQDARATLTAPFNIVGTKVHLAIHSPEKDGVGEIINGIEQKGYSVIVYMTSMASLEKAWDRYKELSFAQVSQSGSIDISPETILSYGERIKSIPDIKLLLEDTEKQKTHQTSHLLEVLLGGAISIGASDIHIEPEEKEVRLRYRIDGVLQDVLFFPHTTFKLINTRIKLLSGMKLTMKAMAQDGRFSIFLKDTEISIRSSMIPGAYGESIVMRILDPKAINVKIEELGMPENLFTIIEKEIRKPNGMILLTGPTGSGKTTTLYAFLSRIYSVDIKIITIEDPIEYHLNGITQTQVDHARNYTFLEGLRSALRQDPDVIMVGEIRDSETANTAIESALTGHLVFSTLHTNSASGVIPRLIDLSVNAKTIPSALSLAIAQRLVRKVCQSCKYERAATPEEINTIKKVLDTAIAKGKDLSKYGITDTTAKTVWEGKGCDVCHKTGFKGRLGIFEAIQVNTPEIEKIIPTNPSDREIKEVADKQGILDMKEDGVIKVLKGITTLAEVKSVVDVDED